MCDPSAPPYEWVFLFRQSFEWGKGLMQIAMQSTRLSWPAETKLFFVLYHFMLPGNFHYGLEIRHGIFWGINFGPVIFFFFFKPKRFLGFWLFIIPVTWNPEYPLWVELSSKGRWIFHTFHPKLIYIFLIGNCVGESNEKNKPSLSRKMHLNWKFQEILVDFNSHKVPFPWGSGYWPVPFSSDKALKIAGLFHQGQFPYCSRYEARRVQNFPEVNLESIFITIYLLWKIRPISVKRWKMVWIRACPIPGANCPLGESPTTRTTSHCQVECWHVWLWK